MNSSELGMIHSVFTPTVLPNYGLKPLVVQTPLMTVTSLFIPHLFHLLAINKGKSHNSVFQRCLVKPAWHGSGLKQAGRDSVASRLHSRWVIPNVLLMNQLGFISPERRCSDTIHVLACSPTGWTHPDQVDRIHGYSPVDQFMLLQLLQDHLVWFCRYPEKSGTGACRKVHVETD